MQSPEQYSANVDERWAKALDKLQQLSHVRQKQQQIYQQSAWQESERQRKLQEEQMSHNNLMSWLGLGLGAAGTIAGLAIAPFTKGASVLGSAVGGAVAGTAARGIGSSQSARDTALQVAPMSSLPPSYVVPQERSRRGDWVSYDPYGNIG